LRGPHATIVRRWSPDTRLNGHAFSDAPLSAGDCLSIGPIELEVLQTIASPSPTQSAQTAKNQDSTDPQKLATRLELARRLGHRRAHALVEQIRDARREIAQLKDQRSDEYQQGEELLRRRAGEMDAREAQLASDRQTLEEQRRQHEEQRSQLDSQRESLERDRQTWEAQSREAQAERSQRDALRREIDEQRAQLAGDRQTLEEQRRQHEEQRSQLDSQRESLERDRRTWEAQSGEAQVERSQLDALRREIDEQRAQWDAARAAQEQELARRREDFETREAQLAADRQTLAGQWRQHEDQRSQLDSQREALERDRQTWEAQSGEAQAERSQLDALRREIDEQRAQWDATRPEQEQELARRREDFEAREAQLAADRQTLEGQWRQHEDQRSQLDSQREALERDRRTWEAQSGEAQAERSQLEASRREIDEQRAQWDATRREQEQELARRREDLGARERELEAWQREWEDRRSLPEAEGDEPGSAEPGYPSESAPVDASEILGRLGVVPLVPDDEPELSSPEVESVAASRAEAAPAREEDDESINEYMARLMQRVRTVAQEPVAPGPRRESERPVASEPEAPPRQQEPVDRSPRRSTPEDAGRLSAMRELASASAHSAIDLHARTKHRESVREKLLFTVTALVCGVGLIGAWARFGASNVSYYVGLISLLAGVVWAMRYAVLSGWIKVGQYGGLNWRSAKPSGEAPDAGADGAGKTVWEALPEETDSPRELPRHGERERD
jgi:epidermal growth factor receptor substrate 15